MRDGLVCSNCVGDLVLASEISGGGLVGNCMYCGESEHVMAFEDLAVRVDDVMHEFVHDTDIIGGHGRMNASEVLNEMLDGDARLVDDLVGYLASQYRRTAADDEELQLYDETSSTLEIKIPEDSRHADRWRDFCDTIKHGERFLNATAKQYLDEIFDRIAQPDLFGGRGIMTKLLGGNKSEDVFLYRAREASTPESRATIYEDLPDSLGPPPRRLRKQGRMNAAGIVAFYGCLEPDLAVAELRVPVGGKAVVGKFKLLRPVCVLNLPALERWYERLSFFEDEFVEKRAFGKFVRNLHDQVRKPILPESATLEYLPTQYLAEYLANHFVPQIDGVLYSSALTTKESLNLVLFRRASVVQRPNKVRPRPSSVKIEDLGEFGEIVTFNGVDDEYGADNAADEKEFRLAPIIVTYEDQQGETTTTPSVIDDFGDDPFGFEHPTKEDQVGSPTLALIEDEIRVCEVRAIEYTLDRRPVTLGAAPLSRFT